MKHILYCIHALLIHTSFSAELEKWPVGGRAVRGLWKKEREGSPDAWTYASDTTRSFVWLFPQSSRAFHDDVLSVSTFQF